MGLVRGRVAVAGLPGGSGLRCGRAGRRRLRHLQPPQPGHVLGALRQGAHPPAPAVPQRRLRRPVVPARHSGRRLRPLLDGLRRPVALQHVQGLRRRGAHRARSAGRAVPDGLPGGSSGFAGGLAGRAVPPRVAGDGLSRRQLARIRHQASPPVHVFDRELRLVGARRRGLHAAGGRQGSRHDGLGHAARGRAARCLQLLRQQRLPQPHGQRCARPRHRLPQLHHRVRHRRPRGVLVGSVRRRRDR